MEMKEHGDEGLVGILKLCRVVRVSPHLQRDIHFLPICCGIGLVLESSGCSKLLGFGHVVGRVHTPRICPTHEPPFDLSYLITQPTGPSRP